MNGNNSYYSQVRPEMVPFVPVNARRILDAGCGNGLFGESLKRIDKEKEIWGIEINKNASEEASKRLDKVICGDIYESIGLLPKQYFDCILFNDVLEHLIDPFACITMAKSLLRTGSSIVCSFPNVRHITVLKNLVWNGDWLYTDSGILDRTHLRFFTKNSIKQLFYEAGYEVETLQGINVSIPRKMKFFYYIPWNRIEDTKFFQFACVAKLVKK